MQSGKFINFVRVTTVGAAALMMWAGTAVPGGSAVMAAQKGGATNSTQTSTPTNTETPYLGQAPAGGISYHGGKSPEELEQERQLAVDQRKRVASDVDKLVTLSNQLKANVDKSGKDELSIDAIKEAREIEKVAHDLQNRMKS